MSSIQRRFAFDSSGLPIVVPGDEQILHMPDNKPLVDSTVCIARPMTFFRLQFLKDSENIDEAEGMRRLRLEDLEYHQLRRRYLFRRKGKKKTIKLLRGDLGQWRYLLTKIKKKLAKSVPRL